MKVGAIVQARMGSTRLPGKVLHDLAGVPKLLRQIERIRRSRQIDALVVATSSDASDDRLADLLANAHVARNHSRLMEGGEPSNADTETI